LGKEQFEERLRATDEKIIAIKKDLENLQAKKKNDILNLRADDLTYLTERIRKLQDELESQELIKQTLEEKIHEFKENAEPEAARIRKQIADLWPTALIEYRKLKKLTDAIPAALQRMGKLNEELLTLANRHNGLLGPEEGIWIAHLPVSEIWEQACQLGPLRDPPAKPDLRLVSDHRRELEKPPKPVESRNPEAPGNVMDQVFPTPRQGKR
jgi:hypothetical protein